MRIFILGLLLVGCGGATGNDSTPQAVCSNSCAALQTCGSTISPTCASDCVNAGAAYVDCIRAANNDCNAIANCIYGFLCGGVGPSGATSCHDTAGCEGNCNVSNPTAACECGCIQAMSPSTAFDLLVNNECANSCASCQPATFDGAQCNACAAACVAADQCSRH